MSPLSPYRSRAEALYSNATKYYTGKPCIRGHYAERYALNSGCTECMARNNMVVREKLNAAPNEKRAALNQLVEAGMRLFDTDVPQFTDVVAGLTLARYPALSRADVVAGRPTGKAAGTGFYPFRVHAEDVTMLREVATVLRSAHSVDLSGTVAARLAAAAEAADKQRDNGAGEWKFT